MRSEQHSRVRVRPRGLLLLQLVSLSTLVGQSCRVELRVSTHEGRTVSTACCREYDVEAYCVPTEQFR